MDRFLEILLEFSEGAIFGLLIALPGSIIIYYAFRVMAYFYNDRKWPKW